MIQFRHGVTALGLAGLLLAATGCLGPMTSLTTTTSSTVPAMAPARDDLPRDKALQACLTYAEGLDKAGSDEGAIEQYEKVLRMSPEHLEATRRLAVLYDRRSDFTKAEAAYRKLAKAHPRDADLFCDWGYSYYLRNEWKEAETKLRRAMELDKRHTRARCNLGLVLGQEDRYSEAFQLFCQAGLEEADAHCDLAFVYWTKGRLEEAKRECYQARQLNAACSKAQDLLIQIEEAQKPRKERVASNTSTPERPTGRPSLADAAQGSYAEVSLPRGWAPKQFPSTAASPAATSCVAPAACAPVAPVVPPPSAPSAPAAGEAMVTFD
jgi:Flp pilus assembly protein TadD